MKQFTNQEADKDYSSSEQSQGQLKIIKSDDKPRRRDPYHIDSWYDDNNINKIRDLNNIRMYA